MERIILTCILMLAFPCHGMNGPQLTQKNAQDFLLTQQSKHLDFPASIGITFPIDLGEEIFTLSPMLNTSWTVTVEDTLGHTVTYPMRILLYRNDLYSSKNYQAYSIGTHKGYSAWTYFNVAYWKYTGNEEIFPQKLKAISLLKAELDFYKPYFIEKMTVYDGTPYEVQREDIQICPFLKEQKAMLALEIDPQNYKVTIPKSGLTVPSYQVKSNE